MAFLYNWITTSNGITLFSNGKWAHSVNLNAIKLKTRFDVVKQSNLNVDAGCRLPTYKQGGLMNTGNPVTCHELYFDAKGSGLWAGGLSSSGRCGGLEESFEDRLGVHFRSGLRGGSLTGGARWRRQTVFFCAIAGAWSITEPPGESQGAKDTFSRTRKENS